MLKHRAMSAALVAAEIAGYVTILIPIPLVWMWLGSRAYLVTGSLMADLAVAFGGSLISIVAMMRVLGRIDALWVEVRRRAGHDQRDGALTQVVVVMTTLMLVGFWIWFHIIERAFIIPFMPLN